MNRFFIVSLTLVLALSFGFAPVAQADLVTLTVILAAVWTSGVVVNETIISNEQSSPQGEAQNSVSDSHHAMAQAESE